MSDATTRAYEAIRGGILEGRFAAGSALREEQLATEIGVSRTPVREALHRLLADGLVNSVPNSGTFVSDLTEDDLHETFELRSMLEAYVARKAALRISEEQLAELEALADKMERLAPQDGDKLEDFGRLNNDFHLLILQASGSRLLEPILARLITGVPLVPLKQYRLRRWVNIERSNRQHREIIEALREHNAEWAGLRMQSHLLSTQPKLQRAEDAAAPQPITI
jgi:DNA-binding GntR family transcriptional regulator